MIAFEAVSKRYPGQEGAPALDTVSLSVPMGALTAVVGTSGSGKTTLLRCVNRMVEPDSGRVLVGGRPVSELDPIALRRSAGYVIQGVGLFPHLSVAGNVGVVPSLLGWDRASIERRVAELLDLVRLPRAWAARRPGELSGGEAQRVGVARALAADPPILLMDEPFGALDALTRSGLQKDFDDIRRRLGKTVLLVTHDLGEAFRLADRVVVMRDGRIAAEGAPAKLASSADPLVGEFLSGVRALGLLAGEARLA